VGKYLADRHPPLQTKQYICTARRLRMYYDNSARVKTSDDLRAEIAELDVEIDRVNRRKQEVEDAIIALTATEALLRRMSMLAREIKKTGNYRPGLVEEFEECKRKIKELSPLAPIDDKIIPGS